MEHLKLSSPFLSRYSFAIVVTAIGLLLTVLAQPIIPGLRYMILILAVVISAQNGGFSAGLLSSVLSAVLTNLLLNEPRFALITTPTDLPPLVLFLIVTISLSWLEENRQHTHRALHESRNELDLVLKGISDGVSAQDAAGRIIFANEPAAQLSGFASAAELISTPLTGIRAHIEMLDEQGAVIPREKMPSIQARTQGISGQITFRMHYLDSGEERWILLKSTPVFNEQGKVERVVNIFRDINERKAAELELRQQRERLLTMLASINNGVIATNSEGMVEIINPAGEALTGWKQADAAGKPADAVFKIVDGVTHEAVENPITQVLKTHVGINPLKSMLLINRDGQEIQIDHNAAPIKDQNGELVGAILAFWDDTERRRSENELLRLTMLVETQRRRFQHILNSLPGIVWESSNQNDTHTQKLDFVSNYAEKMLGYPVKDWLSVPNFGQQIMHPDDIESSIEQGRKYFESGDSTMTVQYRCIAQDGRIVPVETYLTLLKDDKGQVLGTCGLVLDVSQCKEAEAALEQYALDLKHSNEQLEQFAYVASHDLQEPLRMITSYLQLLESRYKDQIDEDANEFIAFAVDGASRMKTLINDLLAYSHVKTDERDFSRFETETALQQALTNLQVVIEENQAKITCDTLPAVKGNEMQFVQLFQNLLSNAIKFRSDQPPEIHISASRVKNYWQFAVRDNGIGIEPQYKDRIFVIFQRLHTKEEYKGTGIGLAICKKVVEYHGGRIWIESQPNTGTTFYFTVPINNK
jgi:PAS domain S-box-containing protein